MSLKTEDFMNNSMLSMFVVAFIVPIYPAAKLNKQFTVLTIDSGHKHAGNVLFCSTEGEQEDPQACLDDALRAADDPARQYKWLFGSKRGQLTPRIKVELLQPGHHIHARMGRELGLILNTLGKLNPDTRAVVLGGHNPFKPARVVIDYQEWLRASAHSVASDDVPGVPCYEQVLAEVKQYAEDSCAEIHHDVTQATINACTCAVSAMQLLIPALNVSVLSAAVITTILEKTIRTTPTIIGVRLQLACTQGMVMFDAYRVDDHVRIATLHNGKFKKQTF